MSTQQIDMYHTSYVNYDNQRVEKIILNSQQIWGFTKMIYYADDAELSKGAITEFNVGKRNEIWSTTTKSNPAVLNNKNVISTTGTGDSVANPIGHTSKIISIEIFDSTKKSIFVWNIPIGTEFLGSKNNMNVYPISESFEINLGQALFPSRYKVHLELIMTNSGTKLYAVIDEKISSAGIPIVTELYITVKDIEITRNILWKYWGQ